MLFCLCFSCDSFGCTPCLAKYIRHFRLRALTRLSGFREVFVKGLNELLSVQVSTKVLTRQILRLYPQPGATAGFLYERLQDEPLYIFPCAVLSSTEPGSIQFESDKPFPSAQTAAAER